MPNVSEIGPKVWRANAGMWVCYSDLDNDWAVLQILIKNYYKI